MLHLVGVGYTVLAAQIAPLGSLFDVTVLHQRCRFFGSTGTQVQSHQGQCSGRLAPRHKFIGAELVGLDRVPGFVQHTRAVRPGTDAIQPVVAGHEVAAWIPHDRYSQLTDFIENIFAKPVGIGRL